MLDFSRGRQPTRPGFLVQADTDILIADDDPVYCSLIRKTLREPAYVFIEVKIGHSTLSAAWDYQRDLAILDILMPPPNGIQLCQLMKADRDLRRIRVLLLTAPQSAAEGDRAFHARCDAYLVKPCGIDQLRATVAQLLSCPVHSS